MLSHAADTATSDDEQAVSSETLGPFRSSRYEMRLDAMLAVEPLFVYASTSSVLRELEAAVVVARNADEHPDPPSAQLARGHPCILDRFPGNFQQPSLLRIHADRFTGRDAPESRIEVRQMIEESAAPHHHAAGGCGVGMVETRRGSNGRQAPR